MEKPLVLLADDNEATCTLIAALLRNDFVCEIARDGSEAIEKLRHRRYSAILLDLLMPVVDGYEVLDFIVRERPALMSCVVVVTAALSDRQRARLRDYEVSAVIRKPFEVDVLLETVKRCTGVDAPHAEPFLRGGSLLSSGMLLLLADLLRRC